MNAVSALYDPSIYASLAFLFGVAAQFRAMGGYSLLRGALAAVERTLGVLYAVALVTFVFSPFVLNDVLVLILTPPLIKYAKAKGVDPAPLVVAEVTFTNISSALTPIGNPQNILLWTSTGVGFVSFLEGTWVQVLVSAAIASAALLPIALRTGRSQEPPPPIGSLRPAYYLALVTAVVLASDAFGLPAWEPLGAGFLLGFAFTFRSPEQVWREYDLRSLVVLCFFVASVAVASRLLMPVVSPYVIPAARGDQPYSGLFMGGVSNLISNVPATQLLINAAGVAPAIAPKIAVEAGLAGNIGPLGSFANILALQMAARSGVSVRRMMGLQFVVGVLAFLPALL